jgi:predicted transposase/invertase (TIGR01784 family)
MARYLDPKSDFVFKRIFGEHKDLLMSFLNALMPLAPGQKIESLEYLPQELVPENPAKRLSIVDVRCIDNAGRQFIVEMQVLWTDSFYSRMVFNASKAYVRQLGRGENYELLQPVYGLGILDTNFDKQTPKSYHHYKIVNIENSNEVIKGLEFVLIELRKNIETERYADKRMAVLWLRFLKEIGAQRYQIAPDDLLANEHIRKAVEICEEGGFTDEELDAYDRFWDSVRIEKAFINDSLRQGLQQGEAIGLKKGREEGLVEGLQQGLQQGLAERAELEKALEIERKKRMAEEEKRIAEKKDAVLKSLHAGIPIATISSITGLPEEEIQSIIKGEK